MAWACAVRRRSAGVASRTIRRVSANHAHGLFRPRTPIAIRRSAFQRLALASSPSARDYHGGGGGGGGYESNSGPNWDSLVYSITSNLRGQVEHGPECFYSALSDESSLDDGAGESKGQPKARRDMRVLVPLRLNRAFLLSTAQDLRLRITHLCKAEVHTPDYLAVQDLIRLLEKLGGFEEESPLLELNEYLEIWTIIRDGMQGSADMPLQSISINEQEELKKIRWNAEVIWGLACLNAAVRNVPGKERKVDVAGSQVSGDGVGKHGWKGDLRSLSFKVLGVVLDSKDFFPQDDKWFDREQEEAILEVVGRVWKEASRRSDL